MHPSLQEAAELTLDYLKDEDPRDGLDLSLSLRDAITDYSCYVELHDDALTWVLTHRHSGESVRVGWDETNPTPRIWT